MDSRITYHKNDRKNKTHIFLKICLIGLISSLPFIFSNTIYFQDDYVFHLSRMEAYANSVRNFDLFPKIFYEYANGAGYGVDLFYPSILTLPYAFLRILGFSSVYALNLFYFILNCCIAGSSFFLGKSLFKNNRSSLLLSLMYTLSTYRFCDEIARGAIGEVFGFIFIPIAFLGLYQIVFGDKKKWYWLTIGMSFLIISHLLSAYMFFFFILLFLCVKLIMERDIQDIIKRFLVLCIAGITTFMLTMWHLFEIIQQSNHMDFNYSRAHLYIPTSDFGGILRESFFSNIKASTPINNVGTFLICMLVVLWCCFFFMNRYSKVLLIMTTMLIFMTSSSFPWPFFVNTPVKMIQFPFRLVLFCTLFLILLICYVCKKIVKNNATVLAILSVTCVILFLCLSFSYTPKRVNKLGNDVSTFYADRFSLGDGQEYIKKGLDFSTATPKKNTDIEVINNQGDRFVTTRVDNKLEIKGEANEPTEIITPFFYYYGYVAIDGEGNKIPCKEQNGKVAIQFPKGNNSVTIYYQKTALQKTTSYISLATLVVFIVGAAYFRRNNTFK